MSAYRTIDAWIRAWGLPEVIDENVFPAAGGAAVILRLHGEVVGRGSDIGEGQEGKTAIVVATRMAFSEAERRLPVDNDALRDETVKRVANDITMSVELAGPLVPLGARTFEEAAKEISVGVDGVAVRIGTRVSAVFPSSMLMQSISTRMALGSAAAQAGREAALGLVEMEKLIAEHGAKFYRFRTIHLAQGAAGSAPGFLYRGGRVVALNEMTGHELRAMADRAAEHVLTHAWPGREAYGLTGTYDACRDSYEPVVASAVDQMMACVGLVRYARVLEVGTARRAELLTFVDKVMQSLAVVEPREQDASSDAMAAAAWMVATGERAWVRPAPEASTQSPEFTEKCRRTVLGSYRMDDGYVAELPRGARPLVALALVQMAKSEAPGVMRKEAVMLAESAVRRVFREAGPGELVANSPWIGWAELELTALKSTDPQNPEDIPSAVALRELRKQVWAHQVSATDDAARDTEYGGPDMVGGIVFTAGGAVLPTWQSARALAFMATMLGDSRLTAQDERALELARLIGGLRYLRQLQLDDSHAWMCPNRRKAMGGVRTSTWDQRTPLDATAMTLMTVSEAIRSLEAMMGR